MPCHSRLPGLLIRCSAFFSLIAALLALASQASRGQDATTPAAPPPQHWALIIVGLGGDEEHETAFQAIAGRWQQGLQQAGFDPARVRLIAGPGEGPSVTREQIADEFTELSGLVQPPDVVWIFWLGHGNYDNARPAFHVRGPDLDDADMLEGLDALPAQQQIVWLTHASSGWFLRRLSAPQRIVIAATAADQEPNETEFPERLAEVLQTIRSADQDQNGRVSVLELFSATVRATEAHYAADQRVPTEHAQLDDNGDGLGTELADVTSTASEEPAPELPPDAAAALQSATPRRDGRQASEMFLPLRLDATDPEPELTSEPPTANLEPATAKP